MTEGPFKHAFEADTEMLVRREIVTYRYRDGLLVKETAMRNYFDDGDYIDSSSNAPLHPLGAH